MSGDESVNIVRLGIKKRGRCEQSVLGFQGPTKRKLALGAENVTSASVILNVMINIIGFCMKITSVTLETKASAFYLMIHCNNNYSIYNNILLIAKNTLAGKPLFYYL